MGDSFFFTTYLRTRVRDREVKNVGDQIGKMKYGWCACRMRKQGNRLDKMEGECGHRRSGRRRKKRMWVMGRLEECAGISDEGVHGVLVLEERG